MLKKRFRYNLYRKYEEDITGNFIFSEKKANKILKLLFMALLKKNKNLKWLFRQQLKKKYTNVLTPFRIFTYKKKKKVTYKMLIKNQQEKLNIYYGNYDNKLKFIFKNLYYRFKGIQKNTMVNFLCAFEGRIDIFLYKMGLFKSLKFVKLFLELNIIKVNDRYIEKPNYILLPFRSIISFENYTNFFFRLFFYNKLFFPESFFFIPKYHYYDFFINEFSITKKPVKLSQIKYPFKMNGNILISWLRSNF